MSDDSPPPPYSAVPEFIPAVKPLAPESAETVLLPFTDSDQLAAKIKALVSEGKTLDSRFKDVRDVASAGAKFEYQAPALALSQKFETLVWESRNIAGVALVAVKDFDEIVLDFLSQRDAMAQDKLKELSSASTLLQSERRSVTKHRASFDTLVKELGDFHQMIHSELGTLIPKKRKQKYSRERQSRGTRPSLARKSKPPYVVPRSETMCGVSNVTTSLGVVSRTVMDYTLKFERMAEEAFFPSCVLSPPLEAPAQDTSPRPAAAPQNTPERKRICAPTEGADSAAFLGLVDTLVHDLRAFVSRLDVFETVFTELARTQDIFILYLKDGKSIADQGYQFEINRLRRHLPRVYNALDSYSKARSS